MLKKSDSMYQKVRQLVNFYKCIVDGCRAHCGWQEASGMQVLQTQRGWTVFLSHLQTQTRAHSKMRRVTENHCNIFNTASSAKEITYLDSPWSFTSANVNKHSESDVENTHTHNEKTSTHQILNTREGNK